MRGKPARLPFATCARRITPADAGKTASTDSTLKSPDGSPPRMRGKPSLDTNRNNWRRITPADAGKTTRQREHVCSRQDHPRGCGENGGIASLILLNIGSPPRMRGKLSSHNAVWSGTGDHPRGCGENALWCGVRCALPGSPPRMRGKPLSDYDGSGTNRITPADAGKTTTR